MRLLKTGIPFIVPVFLCGILFASCEKTLLSHKTTDYGKLDYVPSSVPDSVSDGASFAILDYSGNPTSLLHTWAGNSNTIIYQYIGRSVTVYGQTHSGYLSSGVKHIDVDSVKLN